MGTQTFTINLNNMKNNKLAIPNSFYRISVKALILNDEKKFLLTLEGKGLWELPGGGLDFGEKPQDCLVREIKEEMGLEVININNNPSYFLTAEQRDGRWWICNILYEVKVKNFNFTPSDECVEMRFFTKEEAENEKLFPNVSQFISLYNPKNHNYSSR